MESSGIVESFVKGHVLKFGKIPKGVPGLQGF